MMNLPINFLARSLIAVLRGALIPAALLLAAPAEGANGDRTQPIRITADRVAVDQKQGINKYSGNVRMIQGSLRINADEVVVRYRGNQVETVLASGKPLTFRQRPDAQAPEISASARRLQFHALENRLDLFEQVAVRRGEDTIRSTALHYDLENNVLSASGKEDEERVYTVLQPKKNDAPAGARPAP